MKYNLGFEIRRNLNIEDFWDLISKGIKNREVMKIEQSLCSNWSSKEREAESSGELLFKEMARLKYGESKQECWRIYLAVGELEDYMQKESYWLEKISEKLGAIARPLTYEELMRANWKKKKITKSKIIKFNPR